MKLFEYAVIFVPNEESTKAGKKASVLVPPTTMLANDPSAVQLAAAKKIPDEFNEVLDQVQVAVRPF